MFLATTLRNNIFRDIFGDLDGVLNNDIFIDTNKLQKPFNHKIDSDDNGLSMGITLSAEVPGYNKDMIDVTIEGDTLIIEGKPSTGDTNEFNRKFNLNKKIDYDSIEASILDGILTIGMKFKEEVKPKKIKIN